MRKKIDSNNTSKTPDKTNFQLLLCPYCFEHIPFISLSGTQGNILLNIQCTCLKTQKQMSLNSYLNDFKIMKPNKKYCTLDNTHSNTPMEYYCINCKVCLCQACFKIHQKIAINHCVTSRVLIIDFRCEQHPQKRLKYHCSKCQQDICSNCKNSFHVDHQTSKQKDFNSSIYQDTIDICNNVKNDLFRQKNQITNKIEKMNDLLLQSLKEINTLYKNTFQSFDQTQELLQRIKNTHKLTNDISFYHLNQQLNNCISQSDLFKPKSIEKTIDLIISNFINNFQNCFMVKHQWDQSKTLSHSRSSTNYLFKECPIKYLNTDPSTLSKKKKSLR